MRASLTAACHEVYYYYINFCNLFAATTAQFENDLSFVKIRRRLAHVLYPIKMARSIQTKHKARKNLLVSLWRLMELGLRKVLWGS